MKKGEVWLVEGFGRSVWERVRIRDKGKRYQGLALVPVTWETGPLAGRPALLERAALKEKI